jgi:hypothetical protein
MTEFQRLGTLFTERQYFSRWWLLVIIPAPIITTILEFTSTSSHENDKLIALVIVWILCGSIATMFLWSHLDTEIIENEIRLRYPPFINKPKVIPYSEIKSIQVRKYDPLGEYGGWGLRYGWTSGKKNRAYNIKGDMGLQLVLNDDMRILIGTMKPDELRVLITARFAGRAI